MVKDKFRKCPKCQKKHINLGSVPNGKKYKFRKCPKWQKDIKV